MCKVSDIVFGAELAELHPKLRVRITVTSDPDTAWDEARGQVTRALLADIIPDFMRGAADRLLIDAQPRYNVGSWNTTWSK